MYTLEVNILRETLYNILIILLIKMLHIYYEHLNNLYFKKKFRFSSIVINIIKIMRK